MRILVSGASGMIGRALTSAAQAAGHETGALVRRPPQGRAQWHWDPSTGAAAPAEAIEWADVVVNLAGASIGKLPWTRRYRHELLSSRVQSTGALVDAITASAHAPSAFVSASAVGYYGDRPGETLTETASPGSGYLANLCVRWEAVARQAASSTRVATIRTGLVLAEGGSLAPLMLATRLYGAARVGPGTQVWPWIALTDVVGAILHTATHSIEGPVNLAAPPLTTSEEVTRTLAAVMGRPHLLTLPARLLRLPLGPAADEILLLSQHVHPQALLDCGYRFTVPVLRDAIAAAVAGEVPLPRSAQPLDGAALAELTVPELREIARTRGRSGYSRMTKAELIELLRA